jgi:hypothetical protein
MKNALNRGHFLSSQDHQFRYITVEIHCTPTEVRIHALRIVTIKITPTLNPIPSITHHNNSLYSYSVARMQQSAMRGLLIFDFNFSFNKFIKTTPHSVSLHTGYSGFRSHLNQIQIRNIIGNGKTAIDKARKKFLCVIGHNTISSGIMADIINFIGII